MTCPEERHRRLPRRRARPGRGAELRRAPSQAVSSAGELSRPTAPPASRSSNCASPLPPGSRAELPLRSRSPPPKPATGPVVVGRHPISQYRAPSFLRRAATRPHVRLVAAACLLVAVAAGSFGWLAASHRAAPEPAQVAAVVAMMTPGSAPTTALRAGEHLVIGGQHLVVRAYQLEGTEEIVATSARPFPVPSTSHLLSGSSPRAWMATKGRLSMYGVNRRGPAASPCSSWRRCPWRKCPKWRPVSGSSELHLRGRPGLQSIRGGERL